MNTPTIDEKPTVMRNEKGQLLPGFTANPHGKPKGAKRMTTLLWEAIEKVADGDDEPADRMIVKKVLQMARRGDLRAIELVWDRIEGKASQIIMNEYSVEGLSEEQKNKLDNLLGIC